MKAFASWSGGKDCMLAAYRFMSDHKNHLEVLVNMCSVDGKNSLSHNIEASLIKKQAECMNIHIVQQPTSIACYHENLIKVIEQLKKQGINCGVFGDIYLQEHKEWIENLCEETDIKPVFPLWREDTKSLINEFIEVGFQSTLIAIDNTKLDKSWLGRIINDEFHTDILKLKNIDPCAEKGEYHSFVFDGPGFENPVPFLKREQYTKDKTTYLKLMSNE